MTINLADNDPRVSYAVAAGVTQSSFTVSFEFFDNDDLNVYVDGTLKTLTTDYTVTGGDGSTGTVTMSVTGASGGSTVVITRSIDLERTTDFPVSGSFNIASLNTELDRFVAINADLNDQISRSLKLTDYDADATLTLPDLDTRKGTVLAFNSTTGNLEAGPTTTNVNQLADVTDDIATLADIEDGTDATDAIQTAASISANITTVAGISSNVTTVAGISSNVTTVAGDSSDIQTVAGKSDEIGRLGTADAVADMNTLGTAAIVADMDTLADISADITTVAGVDSDVTTVAGISANVTTVAGISSNVTTVAGDTTNIGTVATNIADVNTAATNITAIQNASTNATTATTKASEAATSATNAATSETNAATSETNAATSATAAAASQVAAAASASSAASAYDTFDDRYLGSKTANPTVDNDGNALVQGALFFNSTANEMRVYDGANWIAASSAGGASMLEYLYIATASQTAFSGSDENSNTLSYTVDNLIVVLNGVILEPSVDYTATDGLTVTLTDAASLNDEVHIIAFKSFTTADMVSATNGGTFGNNITVTGSVTATSFAGDGSALTGIEGVPSGVIVMWSGTIANIPSGWKLCDGTNSTPDLRERFIVGSGTDSGGTYDIGDTGGANTVSLAEANLPSHTHGSGNIATSSAGSHTHNGTTNNTGAHTHNTALYNNFSNSNGTAVQNSQFGTNTVFGNLPSSSAGAHSHNLTINSAGAHTHTISGDTGSTGSGTSFSIVPSYYALAFIMKT